MSQATEKPVGMGGECAPSKLGDVTTLKVTLALLLVGTHGLAWLHGFTATHLAPAVPVFLFLSGYFMLANYKRSPHPLRFMLARYLKLFPIMVVSLIASLGLLLLYGGWPLPKQVLAALPWYVLTHLTVFQNFVPPAFEMFGQPVKNGSLWFIEAILVLYATLPLIALLERHVKGVLVILCITSAAIYVLWPAYAHNMGGGMEAVEAITGKRLDETAPPLVIHILHIARRVALSAWMFYAGCLIRRRQEFFFSKHMAVFLVAASLSVTLLLFFVGAGEWNYFGPIPPWYFPGYLAAWIALHLCCLQKVRVPPISIGLYVLHIPVFYALIYLGWDQLWLAVPLVILLAWVSLHVIERPVASALSRLNDRSADRPSQKSYKTVP